MDQLGVTASRNEKQLMIQHFIVSSLYEFMFWQQAYRLESWPI
jgi:thiaminase/transcriptional activator TenA